MTSAFPPREHNPHEWAALNPVAEPVVVHSPVLVVTPVEDQAVVSESEQAADAAGRDYDTFTKADLQAQCEVRKLPTSGSKPDLVQRLKDADTAAAEPGE